THALSRIDDFQNDFAGASLRLDGQFSTVGHRLLRIEQQIQQRLLEHLAIQSYLGEIGREVTFDVDSLASRHRSKEIAHLLDHHEEIVGDRLQILGAGEFEEVIGQIDEAIAFADEAIDAIQSAAFARGLRFVEVLGEVLQAQPQGAQVVLDIVNESA